MTRLLVICIGFLGLTLTISSFTEPDTNAKIKAIFIYNFTKYVEWPVEDRTGIFTIGVLGNSGLIGELHEMALRKMRGVQEIRIKTFAEAALVEKCHILIVTSDKSSSLPLVISKIGNASTLIITDGDDLARKGSGINFIISDNKQNFELNLNNIEKSKMKVSSYLTSFAVLVQ